MLDFLPHCCCQLVLHATEWSCEYHHGHTERSHLGTHLLCNRTGTHPTMSRGVTSLWVVGGKGACKAELALPSRHPSKEPCQGRALLDAQRGFAFQWQGSASFWGQV